MRSSRRRRVLVLVDRFPVTSETFVVDHVASLATAGFEVHVGCFKIDRLALHALRRWCPEHFEVHEAVAGSSRRADAWSALAVLGRRAPALLCSPRARGLADQAGRLGPLLRRLRPDLVHAHFGPTGVVAALALGSHGVPLIVDFHGYDVTSEVREHGWDLYRATLGGATAVTHSGFVEHLVVKHLDLSLRRVPLGVDLRRFSPVPRADGWPDPLRLLTCGRAVFQKGHHVAIEALSLLRRRARGRGLELWVIGEGPELARLRRRAELLGVENLVRFLGAVDPVDVAEAMERTDVLLVPSLVAADGSQEAFSKVAVEGMARGLLVIGTTSGGLAETIGAGGRIVPPGDALALAEEVTRCVEAEMPAARAALAVARAAAFSAERSREAYTALTWDVMGAGT